MDNKRLIFEMRYDECCRTEQEVFTFSVFGRAEDYLSTIQALLSILGGISDDYCSQEERYRICSLIGDMLPSYEQIKMIQEQSQKQQ